MSGQAIITASLEGMRVLVDEKRFELQEYDFTVNGWFSKDTAAWPLPRSPADEWLAGWNARDRFRAVSVLTSPPEYPATAARAAGGALERASFLRAHLEKG
jgi:hypothetical protein